ncbi:molecular chaperone [Erythrobacter sp. R86502]|uniref:fimbrial biogenesis chaperone n=1 Tax=Erythrobacter sp. R86502 TaxID=3093846 RepID=UPI0036D2188C
MLQGTAAHPYDVRPIVIQLAPEGAGSTQSVIITNNHQEPIAIEVRAFHRIQNPDGSEKREPEDNDLIITPPQLVIAPGSSQAVRVRWVGDPNPPRELAFRLITEQLPINLATEKRDNFTANVSVNYRYETALYVTPRNAVPQARIERAAPVMGEDGMQMLELDIVSEGTRRASLDKPTVVVTPEGGGSSVTLEGEAVSKLNQLVTLVGSRRTVRIPWPENVNVGPVQAELRAQYIVLQ